MKIEIGELNFFERSILILIFLLAVFITGNQLGIRHGRGLERETWESALRDISKEAEPLAILEGIIIAESNATHGDVWGQDGEYGICQMKKGTFYWLAEKSNLFDYDRQPDWKSQKDQIRLLNWAIRNGYANHWSTYRKIEK